MNAKSALFGIIASLTFVGTLLGPPIALAETSTAVVVVADTGIFTAELCNESDDQVHLTQITGPTASTNGTATGTIYICVHDDKSYRPSFELDLHADDFVSGPNMIAAENFAITHAYRVLQRQWKDKNPPTTDGIGDIGYFQNGAYVAQGAGAAWWMNNTLETPRAIMFGYSGRGTILSVGQVNFELTIPPGTISGNYVSELTLTVMTSALP